MEETQHTLDTINKELDVIATNEQAELAAAEEEYKNKLGEQLSTEDIEKQEKIFKLTEAFHANLEAIKIIKNNINLLYTHREGLAAKEAEIQESVISTPQEESKKVITEDSIVEIQTEDQKEEITEGSTEIREEEELKPIDQQEEPAFSPLHIEKNKLEEQRENILKYVDNMKFWQVWKAPQVLYKYFLQKPKIDKKLDKVEEAIWGQEIEEMKKAIEIDKEKNPFLYWAATKNTNVVRPVFNYNTNTIDLTWFTEQGVTEASSRHLISTGENEGFFEFNIFGFTKVIKNISEIKDEEGINNQSDKALYKIIGPDGTIITDDILGYSNTSDLYQKATNEYEEKIREEFNNLNKTQ